MNNPDQLCKLYITKMSSKHLKKNFSSRLPRANRCFTLFELMVTISIFVILTTVILINNSRFKSDLEVTNLAYEIALAVREAQVYGINVRAEMVDESYEYAYGIQFLASQEPTPDTNPPEERTFFDLFVDINGDGHYGVTDGIEENGYFEERYILRGQIKIKAVCSPEGSGWDCDRGSTDITFKRPDPEAKIIVRNTAGGGWQNVNKIRIVIESPKGIQRAIEVKSTGQITVLQDFVVESAP